MTTCGTASACQAKGSLPKGPQGDGSTAGAAAAACARSPERIRPARTESSMWPNWPKYARNISVASNSAGEGNIVMLNLLTETQGCTAYGTGMCARD